jgi:N-acyl amino acid synthase of PEP-CTERM/exosortase system
LAVTYNSWFEVVAADSPELIEQAFRLRYQVYCREYNYEEPGEYPNYLETDEYDSRSVHSLLMDRIHGAIAGTVRLILPDPLAPLESLPIQRICNHPLLMERRLFLTATAAEVSRFAVSKSSRKILRESSADGSARHGQEAVENRILRSAIPLGLMKATLHMSIEHGITDWFAVMEPSLLRLLSRFGIYFKPIGPMVEYHGLRQPCHAHVGSLLERVRHECPEVWKYVTNDY